LKIYISRVIVLLISIFLTNFLYADSKIDIRSKGILMNIDELSYIVSIENCIDLLSISYKSGTILETLSVSDTVRQIYPVNSCLAEIYITGENRFKPSVNLLFKSDINNKVEYFEEFIIENNLPELSFEKVSILQIDDQQHLNVSVNAKDDIDISYVAFSVTGLKASSLRSAGGVIERAREEAFFATDGFQKVYPLKDEQSVFEFSGKMETELDSGSIAHEGIVLCDIYVVDSSGNRASISQIAFTGEDVIEETYGLYVQPEQIIFTSILESTTIIPGVEFQFRGLTPLPGPGTGIQYESTHPDIIAVTEAGVAYPLTKNSIDYVSIKVSYPGLTSISIPVKIELNKELKSLSLNNLNEKDQLVLSKLNSFFPIPLVNCIFQDDSKSSISSLLDLEYTTIIDDSLTKVIFDDERGLKALSQIESSQSDMVLGNINAAISGIVTALSLIFL